jgi:dihydrofolate reductase
MRKLIVAAFISLDGVMQGPGGPDEDRSGDFRYGGWTVPYTDEASNAAVMDLFSQPFDLLLGRRTYDIFASYWPRFRPEAHNRIADLFNDARKHVVTHRPDDLEWENSHAVGADLFEGIRALKREDGPILLTQGSGDVVRQLLAAGLVDELKLMTFPVVLGHGKRLFGDDAEPAEFRVTHAETSSTGVLITRYARSGEVRTGSFV